MASKLPAKAAAGILSACMLAACADKPAQEPQEEAGSQQEEQQTADTVIWIREPCFQIEEISELAANPFILGGMIEYMGYPIEWNKYDKEYGNPLKYRTDVIAVRTDGKWGLIDYEGNVIYPMVIEPAMAYSQEESCPVQYQPYAGFIVWQENGGGELFSEDFTSHSFILPGGIGGAASEPYVLDHQVLIEDMETMEIIPYENTFHEPLATGAYDDEGKMTRGALISADAAILYEFDGVPDLFAGGFIRVRESSLYDSRGKYGFVRTSDGKEITGGPVYDEAKCFADGYVPVRKGELWGYMDTEGNMATDFVFEFASVLNEGRAFVKYKGLYGTIDLAKTIGAGIPVTDGTLGGGYSPAAFEMPSIDPDPVIGTVTVNVDNLNSRSLPATYGEKLDKVARGQTYDVYDIYENEDYTWYRIEKTRWIASKDGWVTFSGN